MRKAAGARKVEATQMNAHSSRSHAVFILHVSGEHASSGTRMEGVLNLVDLAGSERVSRSGASGERLKEACSINKSLSSWVMSLPRLPAKQNTCRIEIRN